ncbi:DUF4184 family protein [Actinotalea sp. K2]|uniref:DUF4184 family protein n=1 Tax=Actinotalea sp. K2 TaxID=2939438 RepID=UPI00201819CA|nr:DUF4184 family protein [Actinotalea sp. K2]MCL3861187.1 DUF4184 family protein [Actinotalea sp. K2]
MPFTLAHPAAVIPFLRGPLVPAALVAGALAPDVPYFVPVPRHAGAWYEPFVNATLTHHWPGMLTVAVPTAAVLVVLWWFARSPLADLVVRRRPDRAPAEPLAEAGLARALRAGAWIVVSLAIGVLTHVAWDSFTHWDGYAVENLALLQTEVAGVTTARILQDLSTLVGGAILVVWGWRRLAAWRARGGRLGVTRSRAGVIAGVVAVGLLVGALGVRGGVVDGAPLDALLVELVTAGGAATAAGVLVYAAAWHLGARRRA